MLDIEPSIAFIPKADRKHTRVIVGMSGGVDSSVSAYLLQRAGFDVQGLFMKNWNEDDGTEYCTAKEDLLDAQAVCGRLGIHLHLANFARQYWDQVFEHFLTEYQAGRTPNPDVLCNREIKFKVFSDHAKQLGADFIATGHYCRVQRTGGRIELLKGLDETKDQSYFLNALGAYQLGATLFPIGNLKKNQIRALAQDLQLINAKKKDSTGICFIGERRFKDFLKTYLPAQPGEIKTLEGETIGKHEGLMYYTLGQRQGLGIGGVRDAPEAPWYVVGKDLKHNVLKVTQGHDHPTLFTTQVSCIQSHWVNEPPPLGWKGHGKCRYRQADQACMLTAINHNECTLLFDQPQRAVTPGQYLVLYDDKRCLGGAVIERSTH